MLLYNLQAIFKARQIGISPNTATKILNNDAKAIRLNHIEILCEHLCCEPNDLLVYVPNKNKVLPQNHPLNNLIAPETNLAWLDDLKNIPLSHLKEMSKIMSNKNKL